MSSVTDTVVYVVAFNPSTGLGGFDWFLSAEDAEARADELGPDNALGLVRKVIPGGAAMTGEEITDYLDEMIYELEDEAAGSCEFEQHNPHEWFCTIHKTLKIAGTQEPVHCWHHS